MPEHPCRIRHCSHSQHMRTPISTTAKIHILTAGGVAVTSANQGLERERLCRLAQAPLAPAPSNPCSKHHPELQQNLRRTKQMPQIHTQLL
jgi:hypothetical protein